MQSFLLLSLIGSALPPPKPGPSNLFQACFAQRPSRWPSLVASLWLHFLLVLLLPQVTVRIVPESDREYWARHDRMYRTLRIRVPEQLYIASSGPSPSPSKVPVLYRPVSGRDRDLAAARPGARRGRAPGRRRRFELPPLPHRPDTDQTVLQPQYSAELRPSTGLELPEVFFWAPQEPALMLKAFVDPGHVSPPTAPRLLDAAPRLELPASRPAAFVAPGFPLPADALAFLAPQIAMPLRTSGSETAHAGVSADPLPGDPATVLSIASDPLPLRAYLTVPPGNQVGRSPFAEPAPGISAIGGGGQGHSDTGNGTNGPASGGSDSAGGPFSRAGAGLDDPDLSAINPGSPAELAAAHARSPAIEATRVLHPSAGVFDVVVQSAGLEGFPESAGVLSGKPVYSVFLQIGAPKEWILQYCIPAADAELPAISGSVVRLGNAFAPTAPYPRITLRPVVLRRPGAYLMVHGFIDAAGRFQDLNVLGVADPQESANVIAVLDRWEFRPATQQARPVRVEVLLAIPGE